MIDIGKLSCRVRIEKINESIAENEYGEIDQTSDASWVLHAERWAQILTGSSREVIRAKQAQSDVDSVIRVHFDRLTSAITPAMRIKYGDRIFHIESAANRDEAGEMIEMSCREAVPT